jgi:hypothetical protein
VLSAVSAKLALALLEGGVARIDRRRSNGDDAGITDGL